MQTRQRKPVGFFLLAIILIAGIACPVAAVQWSWQVETADAGSTVDGRTSIALDTDGYPHIIYHDYAQNYLKFTGKDNSGAWSEPTNVSPGGMYPSLKFSPVTGLAEVSCINQTNNKLIHARERADGHWWNYYLGDAGRYTSLAIDSQGYPHICYQSGTTIRYFYGDGSGVYYLDVGPGWDSCSLALDSDGDPGIAYSEISEDDYFLKYATIECTPPHPPVPELCLFVPRTVTSIGMIGGQDISLAMDDSGHPHIAFWEDWSSDVWHATKDADVWDFDNIDDVPSGPAWTSIALDSAGYPAVSYQDTDQMDLMFAWEDASDWHTMTVDDAGDIGAFTSLAFDSSGDAHISYIDSSNKVLKYAKGSRVIRFPGFDNDPTDPDLDGIFEDLNGNGRLDFADVVLDFNQMDWIAANEPIAAFDLNGNGRIDFADIVTLFSEI